MFRKACVFFTCFFLLSYFTLLSASQHQSSYAYLCPVIDGKCDHKYWNDALKIEFSHGVMMIKNNYQDVFFLLDITSDTVEDQIIRQPMCDDYFELFFDWDGDGKLSPNIDRMYSICNKSGRLIYRYLLQKDVFSSIYFSNGRVKAGFGPSLNASQPHRFYEIKLPLSEVRMDVRSFMRIGYRVYSKNPMINVSFPENITESFNDFDQIEFAFPPREIELTYSVGSRFMSVNKQTYEMDVAPYIYQRRTFLPIRYVVEPFGGFFEWNSNLQQLLIFVQENVIEMKIDSPLAYVNGKEMKIDQLASITPQWRPPGRVMVPLRFIAESIGCDVKWDARSQKALVKFKRR